MQCERTGMVSRDNDPIQDDRDDFFNITHPKSQPSTKNEPIGKIVCREGMVIRQFANLFPSQAEIPPIERFQYPPSLPKIPEITKVPTGPECFTIPPPGPSEYLPPLPRTCKITKTLIPARSTRILQWLGPIQSPPPFPEIPILTPFHVDSIATQIQAPTFMIDPPTLSNVERFLRSSEIHHDPQRAVEKYPLDTFPKLEEFKAWRQPHVAIPITPDEVDALEYSVAVLQGLPTYRDLESKAVESDSIVSLSASDLGIPDGKVAFLENNMRPIRSPEDKPTGNNDPVYSRRNWRLRIGTEAEFYQRLTAGYAVSLGMCDRYGEVIRKGELWYAAFGMMLDLDEYRCNEKPDRPEPVWSLAELLEKYPILTSWCRFIIPSSRSLFESRPFKARAYLPFPRPITDKRVFHEIGNIICEHLPMLPQNVTKNPIAVAFGAAHQADSAWYGDGYFPLDLIEAAEARVKAESVKRKESQLVRVEDQSGVLQRSDSSESYALNPGHPHPTSNFFANVDVAEYMLKKGWIRSVSGNVYHWLGGEVNRSFERNSKVVEETIHMPAGSMERSCEIEGTLLKIYSNTMKQFSFNTDPNKAENGHFFILGVLFGLDVGKPENKPIIAAALAKEGYGATTENKKLLPPVLSFKEDAEAEARAIANAPTLEVQEKPSYPHFTYEDRQVIEHILGENPDAGWKGEIPVWMKCELFSSLSNDFSFNGLSSEVKKHRMLNTMPGKCSVCDGKAIKWIDLHTKKAGCFCECCQKDYPLGSYLGYELARKVDNATVSTSDAPFLGTDPMFKNLKLFTPGVMTYIGAAMGTGKSTYQFQVLASIVAGAPKTCGIIVVPRISTAQAIHHLTEKVDGRIHRGKWGLFYQGSPKNHRFVGHGAVCVMTSLPYVLREAANAGLQPYIAIDEIDFCYELLSLRGGDSLPLSVKQELRQALSSVGLTLSSQTISTLELEALAQEFGAKQLVGYYKQAQPASGVLTLHELSDNDSKENAQISYAVELIQKRLNEGHNVYVPCSSRRAGEILSKIFEKENPLVYNRFTRHLPECRRFLKDEKLPTSRRLFIMTSAAVVGISINDPKARTVVLPGLHHGKLNAAEVVQFCIRDRGRQGVDIAIPDYNTSLPVLPSYEEMVRRAEDIAKQSIDSDAFISEDTIRTIARAYGLHSLASTQLDTYLEHHIQDVVNMPISTMPVEPVGAVSVENIKVIKRDLREKERKEKKACAIEIVEGEALTNSSMICRQKTIPPDTLIGQLYAVEVAKVVGWRECYNLDEDAIHPQPNTQQKALILELIEKEVNIDRLHKQRRGFLATHYSDTTQELLKSVLQNTTEKLVSVGDARELHSVSNDLGVGEILTAILSEISGKIFDKSSLASTVKQAVKQMLPRIKLGAMGADVARQSRFLYLSSADSLWVDWAQRIVSTWYPASIRTSEGNYTLQYHTQIDLLVKVFRCYLYFLQKNDLHRIDIPLKKNLFPTVGLPELNQEKQEIARQMRKTGFDLSTIAGKFGVATSTVLEWCKTAVFASELQLDPHTSIQEIQGRFLCSKLHARKLLKIARGGLSESAYQRKLDIQTAKELDNQGVSHREIGNIVGRSRRTILRWLDK